MLLFYGTSAEAFEEIHSQGLRGKVKLKRSLAKVRKKKPERILVINPLKLGKDISWEGKKSVKVKNVPPEAIVNLSPYLCPSPVEAAGGYVLRAGKKEPDVLMIYRRGKWDLPKGKMDLGESEAECALREVREEVGISKLTLERSLGTTIHGYERKGKYKIKTTHWYAMHTPETSFVPQEEEDIEAVDWMPWKKAVKRIGYEIFRRHMIHVEPIVKEMEYLVK